MTLQKMDNLAIMAHIYTYLNETNYIDFLMNPEMPITVQNDNVQVFKGLTDELYRSSRKDKRQSSIKHKLYYITSNNELHLHDCVRITYISCLKLLHPTTKQDDILAVKKVILNLLACCDVVLHKNTKRS